MNFLTANEMVFDIDNSINNEKIQMQSSIVRCLLDDVDYKNNPDFSEDTTHWEFIMFSKTAIKSYIMHKMF